MKVLKSGVEMTPEEMRKSRGGLCACGCAPGREADSPWAGSDNGTNCQCSCEPGDQQADAKTWEGAWNYIWIY